MKKLGDMVKPNPYNVFEARRVKFPPSHFEYATLNNSFRNPKEAVESWIEANLWGRYFLGRIMTIDDGKKLSYGVKVGFENSKEMSYFMLACPHLKQK